MQLDPAGDSQVAAYCRQDQNSATLPPQSAERPRVARNAEIAIVMDDPADDEQGVRGSKGLGGTNEPEAG